MDVSQWFYQAGVVIRGNKVVIKTPLITTRYSFIINELSLSVVNVVLV